MKNIRFPRFLALLLIVALVALCAAGCGKEDAPAADSDADYIAQLEQQVADLQNEVQNLSAQLDEVRRSSVLKEVSMTAVPREDSTGALVTISAAPMAYDETQTATFSIQLNGAEVTSLPAQWDGEVYTATFDLDALDGYGYFFTLVESDGTRKQAVINTPENPVYDTYVYLQSSLSAYCNMFVEDWDQSDDKLTIKSSFVQVQLPRIAVDSDLTYSSSQLVLNLNGEEMERIDITIPEGEGEGSYELALTDVSFTMPEMEDDYQLDLSVEVVLSDGQTLVGECCSWYYNQGELLLVAG